MTTLDKMNQRAKRKEIIESMDGFGFPEATLSKKVAEVLSSVAEDIEDSMNRNSESNNKVANRLWWLNMVIAIATLSGAIIAGLTLYFNATGKLQ